MKLKKKIPVIDQADKFGFWGGKFGGNFVPETLKKPIEDLEILFNKLKKDKKLPMISDAILKHNQKTRKKTNSSRCSPTYAKQQTRLSKACPKHPTTCLRPSDI